MARATDLIVSGSSAGGLATILHADQWTEMVKQKNPQTFVAAVPESGLFLGTGTGR